MSTETKLTREQWDRRERFLDDAIKAGKFPHSRRAHYGEMYDRDPAGTTRLVGMLASGIPQTDDPEAYPEEWVKGRPVEPSPPAAQARPQPQPQAGPAYPPEWLGPQDARPGEPDVITHEDGGSVNAAAGFAE